MHMSNGASEAVNARLQDVQAAQREAAQQVQHQGDPQRGQAEQETSLSESERHRH